MKFPGLRVTYYTQTIGGGEYYHAHLLSRRNQDWTVCGVFQVDPTDWFCLLHIFRTHGIEVTETDATQIPLTESDRTAAP